MQWINQKRFEIVMLSLLAIGIAIGTWVILAAQPTRHGPVRIENLPDVVSLADKSGDGNALDFVPVDEIKHPGVFVERADRLPLRPRQAPGEARPAQAERQADLQQGLHPNALASAGS